MTLRQVRRVTVLVVGFCLWLSFPAAADPPAAPAAPRPPLSLSRQIQVRETWLARRYERLLPMMREHGIGLWIVVNEEFHDDPLTALVAPPRPYVGRRDIFVFADAGAGGLRRVAVTGYAEESVSRFFSTPEGPRDAARALAGLASTYPSGRIAAGFGGSRGVTRSLTHDAHGFIVEALGPKHAARLVSAEPLIEQFLDTRTPEEFPHYALLVEWTEYLARRALSNEVIVPGRTTVGDVRRWLYDQSHAAGFVPWFQPDLRIQRRSDTPPPASMFLPVAVEAMVIEPGDVVHLDFGVNYLGFASDWQKMAYVLRPGESEAPEGLKRALANTNTLQDAVARLSRPGTPSAEVYAAVMAEMKQKGIAAQVYSHPLGHHGHALGASIDMRAAARPDMPSRPLRKGSYLALELNTKTPVPEWGGQAVTMMAEDPVHLTDDGWRYFRPRQEELYLIASTRTSGEPVLPDGLYAELATTKGTIVVRLEYEKAPLTVASFVGLAEGTIDNQALPAGLPFFDGTTFHRVVPGHVIQAGIPNAGGHEPGYTLPNEIDPALSHGRAGVVGMANSGPHTGSCQFYVTLGDRSYLDGDYTVFGEVVAGMDVVRAIAPADVLWHVRIVRLGDQARAYRTDTASFERQRAEVLARVRAAEERKAREEAALLARGWPRARVSPAGARFVVRREGSGERPAPGTPVRVSYRGAFLDGRPFVSSADEGRPTPGTTPEVFSFEVGRTRITPGLDEALADMRPGERRTVIVQGGLGYGSAGFYARERPGERRFVIPPNTTLVFEVELLPRGRW